MPGTVDRGCRGHRSTPTDTCQSGCLGYAVPGVWARASAAGTSRRVVRRDMGRDAEDGTTAKGRVSKLANQGKTDCEAPQSATRRTNGEDALLEHNNRLFSLNREHEAGKRHESSIPGSVVCGGRDGPGGPIYCPRRVSPHPCCALQCVPKIHSHAVARISCLPGPPVCRGLKVEEKSVGPEVGWFSSFHCRGLATCTPPATTGLAP
jgi:hypothetical protein